MDPKKIVAKFRLIFTEDGGTVPLPYSYARKFRGVGLISMKHLLDAGLVEIDEAYLLSQKELIKNRKFRIRSAERNLAKLVEQSKKL